MAREPTQKGYRLMTPAEAAVRLNRSQSYIYRLIKNDPNFPAVRPENSRRWWVIADKLDGWMDNLN
ncbi:MAG: hypothetical protein VB081_02260 [Christensenella sp.]|uniref:helix-turn-helix transcriptional regulator n=1 Tax=Christensenella sp. TaxID=1935934 RepID=UPI002B1EF6B7|nr:hypothetical protein [Christensenella sp.]MEA5002302.1 hypothetical protein [Christensenella sp.]